MMNKMKYEIRDKRDKKLWRKITLSDDNALLELLPRKRDKTLRPGQEGISPIRTEKYKRSFVNCCQTDVLEYSNKDYDYYYYYYYAGR